LKKLLWMIWIPVIAAGVLLMTHNREKENIAPPQAKPPATQAEQRGEQQRNAARALALQLQQMYHEEGLDVDVSYYGNTLELTSDEFRDVGARDTAIGNIPQSTRHKFCDFGLWYLKVGYSKGTFSSNVARTVNLGCSQERIARIRETEDARKQWASTLSVSEGSQSIRASADGTTLVFESDSFKDPANMRMFADSFGLAGSGERENLCRLNFTQVRLKTAAKVVRVIPIHCR